MKKSNLMKTPKGVLSFAAFCIPFLIALLGGCAPQPVQMASLAIGLASSARARDLEPSGVSLETAAYDIHGLGPDGASFSVTGVTSPPFTQTGLVPGDWTIYAEARNAAGTLILKSPSKVVTLVSAETANTSLTCVRLAGNGTFSLDLSWPAAAITTPMIIATLTPDGDTASDLDFVITGNSATCTSGTLADGYYTLDLKLEDQGHSDGVVWSYVDSVLICKNQATSASWPLTYDDTGLGVVSLNLETDKKQPLDIGVSDFWNFLPHGSDMTVTAEIDSGDEEDATWIWYLDGTVIPGATDSSTTLGSDLPLGSKHTLSVVARYKGLPGSTNLRFTIAKAGVVSTLAGANHVDGSADGQGTEAQFFAPRGVAVDSSGNIFVADTNNNKIRKITPSGLVSTFAGSGAGGWTDGQGAEAQFNTPSYLAFDSSGNLYVSDTNNNKIRKITPSGLVSTFAGSGQYGSADGTGTDASFNSPLGLAFDSSGNLFVADSDNNKIRKISSSGVVSTLAGTGAAGNADGAWAQATFNSPRGLAIDTGSTQLRLYVADCYNNLVRKITSDGQVATLAGSGKNEWGDGKGTAASIPQPEGLALGSAGELFVSDALHHIRRISTAGLVTTYAGSGKMGATDGTGANARFSNPHGLAFDASGNLYVADTNNNLIRKIAGE